MPRLVYFDGFFSVLSALTVDEHPVADQSGIGHYPNDTSWLDHALPFIGFGGHECQL